MDNILKLYNSSIKKDTYLIDSVENYLNSNNFLIYNNYENIVKDILTNIPIKCKDTFENSINHINMSHIKYHHEPYGWHALCCGHICSQYSKMFGGDENIGFRLGFLHDIGKPFCETPLGYTFGHGQIGAHIADFLFGEINNELKEVLLFIIDQHMCTCTHKLGDHHKCYQVLSGMISNYTDYQKKQFEIYYKALVIGDRLGALGDNPITKNDAELIAETSAKNILSCIDSPPHSGSIIIIMHGSQGCGKSYNSNIIKNILTNKYNLSVGIAERDWTFWMMARRQKLINFDVTYDQYIFEEIMENNEKITRYKKFYPILKKQIGESYKAIFEYMKEQYDIIIIDSCISLDTRTLKTFINEQDVVLVWNGFPQHMFNRDGSAKIDEQVYYPLKQEGAYYRSIIEGSTHDFQPLVCTSRINELTSLINKMWFSKNIISHKTIIHPVSYLNSGKTLEELKSETPYLIIETIKSFISKDYNVIRLTYRDGTQNGNGPILSFRGEIIMQDKITKKWYPLRISLPVTPETGQLRKFRSHSSIYNYLTGLKPYLKGEFTSPQFIPETTKFNKCFILPKVDGSLMTAWCIKKDSPQGKYILSKKDLAGKYLVEIDDCLIGFGSKSCLFLTQTLSYEEEFYKCILGSYESIDLFANKIKKYLENLEWEETASVIFEMVPEHPHDGLTVDYGKFFTTYLSTILYKNNKIKILLPNDLSNNFFESVSCTEISCNTEEITKYYIKKMDEALNGNFIDLEGFMLAFTSEEDDELLYVKLKFPWYYAAHKPDTNFKAAEELQFNSKYDIIRPKLVNLALTANKLNARRNPDKIFERFAKILGKAIFKFKNTYNPENKKDFMIKFKNNPNYFSSFPGADESVKEAFEKLYINFDYSIDKLIPSMWEKVLEFEENDNKLIDFITNYTINNWKIKQKY